MSGVKQQEFQMERIPAILYGEASRTVWLFIHGKCGCKEEGAAFAQLACRRGQQVLAIDLPEHGVRKGETGFDPWHVVPELQAVMAQARRNWSRVCLRANSIGAWFSLQALADRPPEKALFVSPLLDMEGLIRRMMGWAGVDEARLEKEGQIATEFGETLSWEYLCYASTHRITCWDVPTAILYAGGDNLTDRAAAEAFAARFRCALTVLENGEHWFHTPEQLAALRRWEGACL